MTMSVLLDVLIFCFWCFQTDGFLVWEKENSGGDAEAEPAGAQQSHEGTGQRANETGAAGEEDYR